MQAFLEIDFKEEGGSGDGYAKVMSEEFNRRAMELYAEQAKEVDIIITTAAIPGKSAPRLITKEGGFNETRFGDCGFSGCNWR